jgi:hypothetical protein
MTRWSLTHRGLSSGIDVGALRRSANHESVWFHDSDGTGFELAGPSRDAKF